MIKNIEINKRIVKGLWKDIKNFPSRYKLFGGDTETVNGLPMTLQLWNGKDENDIFFSWVNEENIFDVFTNYVKENLLSGYPNIYYFHNLNFDMGIIFYPFLEQLATKHKIEFEYKDMKISAIYGASNLCKIFYKKTTIYLLDSMSFMAGGSLSHWADVLDLPQKKMKRPEGIGEIDYRKLKDTNPKKQYFIEYAKTDVITQWWLGDWIMQQHKKYNVPISVSSAHFSSRIFKKNYLPPQTDKIPFPPKSCLNGALLSYHGGRNGYYWNCPAIFENCCEVDISSSYPYAMVSIPNFSNCEYKEVKEFVDGFEGIYEVTGIYHACKYPPFFTHDLKEMEDMSEFRCWVTSYEIREAIKDKTLNNDWHIIRGWIVIPANYKVKNPFVDFVTEFYNKKETKGIDPQERLMFKIILNSLYGKFIQSIIDDDKVNELAVNENIEIKDMDLTTNDDGSISVTHAPTNAHIYVAGGLFQPVIATLITGFARAYLHRLEHNFKAIHSSTDSVKFNAKLLPKEKYESYQRKLAGNKDKGILGSYGVEVIGKCIILRNKLYLHYNNEGKIEKQAFHGFAGRQKELLQVIDTKNCDYTVKKMIKLREGFRQGKQPFVMQELHKQLDIDLRKLEIVKDY